MSNLLVFLLGVLVSLPPGPADDAGAALLKQVRSEIGSEVEVSLRKSGAGGPKPKVILTFSNWETDVATVGRVRFVIPEPDSWRAVSEDSRTAPPRIRFRLAIDDEALLDSLRYLNVGVVAESVEIRRRAVVISGSVSVGLGYPVPVRLEGVPSEKGDYLTLRVKRAAVFGLRLPASMNGIFSRVVLTLLDLEELDIDYFIAEEADERLLTDFKPVIRKWELKKGSLVVSGYYKAERQ